MNLNNVERERLIGILGRMMGSGVNPNRPDNDLLIHSREDFELINRIFNKLMGERT